MSKEIVVNTHIEKTGGTSLSSWFMQVYGDDRVLIYSPATDTFLRGSEVPDLNPVTNRLKSLLTLTPLISIAAAASKNYKSSSHRNHISPNDIGQGFDVIHGHFTASRFEKSMDDPFTSIILRDPIERMVSHYISWKRRRGKTNQRLNIPYTPEMSFRDFAMLDQMINFQSQALGELSIEDFDLVGTAENLDAFTEEFFRRRGIEGNIPRLTELNRTLFSPAHEALGIDDGFTKVFKEQNAHDYEIYAYALEHLK